MLPVSKETKEAIIAAALVELAAEGIKLLADLVRSKLARRQARNAEERGKRHETGA